jgi:hypothetical protein
MKAKVMTKKYIHEFIPGTKENDENSNYINKYFDEFTGNSKLTEKIQE